MTYTPLEREDGTELSVRAKTTQKNHMKTITKLIYLLTSALSILALMLVSCSSGTTANTTRQTTTTAATTVDHRLPNQSIGYGDIGAGGAHLGGPGAGW